MALKSKLPKLKPDVEIDTKEANLLGPGLGCKFDELKHEILDKIDKEVTDSKNARDYISHKYDELCNKIKYLSELDSTVNGFRSDVKSIEQQIIDLASRVNDIEKRIIFKESPSLTSSIIGDVK